MYLAVRSAVKLVYAVNLSCSFVSSSRMMEVDFLDSFIHHNQEHRVS